MTRNHDGYDHLVYDGELGWIDPECPMESMGIITEETVESYRYRIGPRLLAVIAKPADFGILRLCLEDAEARSKTWRD